MEVAGGAVEIYDGLEFSGGRAGWASTRPKKKKWTDGPLTGGRGMEGGKTGARPASQPGRRRRRRQRVGMRESVSPVVSECVAGRKKFDEPGLLLASKKPERRRRAPTSATKYLLPLRHTTGCALRHSAERRVEPASQRGWDVDVDVDGRRGLSVEARFWALDGSRREGRGAAALPVVRHAARRLESRESSRMDATTTTARQGHPVSVWSGWDDGCGGRSVGGRAGGWRSRCLVSGCWTGRMDNGGRP